MKLPIKPSMRITRHASVTVEDVECILDNIRAEDAFELGCSGATRDEQIAVVEASALDYVWYYKGEPAFAFGIIRAGHVGHLWGFGTADTRKVIPAATKWGLTHWLPDAFDKHGLRRIEVRVPTKSRASIDWLKKLGMTVESACVRDCASNGEVMAQLAYTTHEYRRDYVLARPGPDSGSAAGAAKVGCAEPT